MMENPKFSRPSRPINSHAQPLRPELAGTAVCLGLLVATACSAFAEPPLQPPTLAIRQALAARELDTALQKTTSALQAYPDAAELYFLQGSILVEQNKLEPAVKALSHAVQLDPHNPVYLFEAAQACHKNKQWHAELSLLEHLLELQPTHATALASAAAALEELGRYDEALSYTLRAKAEDPNAVYNRLREARLHRRLGHQTLAETKYRALLPEHAALPAVWLGLAECLIEQGRIDEAIALLQEGEVQTPQAAALPFRRAQGLQQIRRYPQALEAVEKAIRIRPQWPEAHALAGLIYGDLGNDIQAAKAYQKALDNDPERYEIWLNLGIAEARAQQWTRAAEAFQQALTRKPEDGTTMLELARAHYHGRHYTNALDALDRLQNIAPTFPGLYELRGDIYLKQGRIDAAMAAYEQATRNAPDSTTAWHKRAVTLARAGHRLDALPCFNRVLELDPGHAAALRNKRLALEAMGLTNEAALHLDSESK